MVSDRLTNGKPILRFVIITTTANEVVKAVHPEDEITWLNPDLTEASELKPLLVPYPANEMECFPASREGGPHKYPEFLKPVH